MAAKNNRIAYNQKFKEKAEKKRFNRQCNKIKKNVLEE